MKLRFSSFGFTIQQIPWSVIILMVFILLGVISCAFVF